jgi:hypothetical protein
MYKLINNDFYLKKELQNYVDFGIGEKMALRNLCMELVRCQCPFPNRFTIFFNHLLFTSYELRKILENFKKMIRRLN